MRTSTAVKPFYIHLPFQHRRAVDELRRSTGMTQKALIMEAIELLAVKHEIVSSGDGIHHWPDWD